MDIACGPERRDVRTNTPQRRQRPKRLDGAVFFGELARLVGRRVGDIAGVRPATYSVLIRSRSSEARRPSTLARIAYFASNAAAILSLLGLPGSPV